MTEPTLLGDVARVFDCEHRTAPPTDGVPPYAYSVGTRAVRDGILHLERAKPVSRETYESWTRRATPQVGDLIFSREAPMGEVGAVPKGARLCLGQRTVLVRPSPGFADPRFLRLALMAPGTQRWIDGMAIGSTVRHLNVADVKRIPLPVLPPLADQRRIVDILEDHLSRLDAANDYLDAAVRRSRSLAQSMLDGLVWTTDVPTVQLASVLREPMRNGFSARANAAGSIRVLTLTAVTRRTFTNEYTKMTDAAPERVRGLWLEAGDVFVQRANTPELVGSAALYDGEPGWAVFPDLLIRLRADPTLMTPQYLALVLQTERCHRALRARAKGLAGSMPKVDQGAIAALELPCPSLDDQNRIVAEADSHVASIRTLSDAALAAQRRSRALRCGVLDAAFSGRLSGRPSDRERAEELVYA